MWGHSPLPGARREHSGESAKWSVSDHPTHDPRIQEILQNTVQQANAFSEKRFEEMKEKDGDHLGLTTGVERKDQEPRTRCEDSQQLEK